MDITRRSDYALRILRSAYRAQGEYRSVAQIAEEEDVPYAFARSIQHDLVAAGLLSTARGAKGGTVLAVDPAETSMLSVIEAVCGSLSMAPCEGVPAHCQTRSGCAFHWLWRGADSLVEDYFSRITLADLLEEGREHAAVSKALGSGGDADAR